MKVTIAIDPGKHNIGVAEFHDGVLYRAWLASTKDFVTKLPIRAPVDYRDTDGFVYEVVVEKMQVYRGSIAAPLVELAIISSEIAGAMRYAYGAKSVYYTAAAWKGQIGKGLSHDRARAALEPFEIARIELPKAKKTQLDVMDAVALGLFELRRTGVRTGRILAK